MPGDVWVRSSDPHRRISVLFLFLLFKNISSLGRIALFCRLIGCSTKNAIVLEVDIVITD